MKKRPLFIKVDHELSADRCRITIQLDGISRFEPNRIVYEIIGPDAPQQEPNGNFALAASLHPSAAVGGTPTADAVALIDDIERLDRGRYAGPVGWMDASGDGEWGIALRSAQLTGATVRLFAGCGIVADSDPEAELAEAQAKFVPVRDALTAL